MSGEASGGGTTSLLSGEPGGAKAVDTGGTQTPAPGQQTQQQQAPAFTFPDGFDYKSVVPEDIRADPVFTKYKDLDGVFRGLQGAQKILGKDPASLIEIPAPTDTAAQRALMNKLGASEKLEDYKIAPVQGAPEWLTPDKPLGGWLAKTAHEAGVPIGAMNKLYAGFVGQMNEAVKAQQAAAIDVADKAIGSLRQELGDDFDGTVRRAKLGIEKLGGKELRDALEGADLGVHPAVIKALARAGALFEESGDGGDKGDRGEALPSEIKTEAMDLIAKSHAATDPMEKARLQKLAQEKFSRARAGKKL